HAGTLAYMPPERFAGRPGDERGDVYCLGVTLYELLTLRPAFPETNPQHLMGLVAGGLSARPQAITLLQPLAGAEYPSPECLHLLARCYRDLAPRPRFDETSS